MATKPNEQMQKREQSVKTMLDVKKTEIADMLPTHVDVNRFIKSALLVIAGNDKLEKCSINSVVKSVIGAAELGLDFTPAKGLAYLVPFWNKKKSCNEAVFMPGYRGLIQLSRNTGSIKYVEARIVYSNEVFNMSYGTSPNIEHIPILTDDKGDRIGAYAVAHFPDGGFQFDFMTEEEIIKIKARSKSKNKDGKLMGPWADDENEMYKKTPVRRLSKMLPCSVDDAYSRAVAHDNDISKLVGATDDMSLQTSTNRTQQLANSLNTPNKNQAEPKYKEADYEDSPEVKKETKEKKTTGRKSSDKKEQAPPKDKADKDKDTPASRPEGLNFG